MRKPVRLSKLSRSLHHWGSIAIAVPLVVVLLSGILLLLKKDLDWIQPPTRAGSRAGVSVDFERILAAARAVPEAGIDGWSDIDRLDVRPAKGMLKVRGREGWEIQLDAHSGAVLQVAYRRSDLIESIHDGSFFGQLTKRWVFLPAALVLLVLWITWMVLFFHPYLTRAKRRRSDAAILQKSIQNP
ncbi:MAG: PepSY domain-containing protein [Gammaproteobacteria bacterium]